MAQLQRLREEAEKAREEALAAQHEAERQREELRQKTETLEREAEEAAALREARLRLQPGDPVACRASTSRAGSCASTTSATWRWSASAWASGKCRWRKCSRRTK